MAFTARAAVCGLRGLRLINVAQPLARCTRASPALPTLPTLLQRTRPSTCAHAGINALQARLFTATPATHDSAPGPAQPEHTRQAWVYDMFGDTPLERTDIVGLSNYVFGAEPRLDIMHRVVVWQRREWWQGTTRTKSRGEVRGGGRKPWKQKGTGRARVSSTRNPIWRGGGVVHGPKPRDNSIKLPKKVHYMALRTALSVKLGQGDLVIVEDFDAATPKTKAIASILEDSKLAPSVLFCDGVEVPKNFALAVRNIPKCAAINVSELSVYEMLLRHRLVLTRSAVAILEELLGPAVFTPTMDAVNIDRGTAEDSA